MSRQDFLGIIAVDPGLTGTGVVVLKVQIPLPVADRSFLVAPAYVGILNRTTIKTKPEEELALRLVRIYEGLRSFIAPYALDEEGQWSSLCLAVEDPTVFESIPGMKRRKPDVAKVGAAFAACVTACHEIAGTHGWPILAVGIDEWYPRDPGRKGKWNFIKKETVERLIRAAHPGLATATEHECMAAGMALRTLRAGQMADVIGPRSSGRTRR